MTRVLLLGTCRIHRPFLRNAFGFIVNNTAADFEFIYPRVGFFHSISEIVQVAMFIHSKIEISPELGRYVFRYENPATTPNNEFDPLLCNSIKSNLLLQPSIKDQAEDIDCYLIEVSSLTCNLDVASGLYFHANPNFVRNVSYSDIYPDGYYKKYEPLLNIVTMETDRILMLLKMRQLRLLARDKPVIVLGHLIDTTNPNQTRLKLNVMLEQCCSEVGFVYFDTGPFVKNYGFLDLKGTKDIHHLSSEGECAVALALQSKMRSLY